MPTATSPAPAAAPARVRRTDLAGLTQEYRTEGYCIARQVIDQELVEEGRAHVAWLLEKNPGVRPEQLHNHLVAKDPFWVRLISDERLLDVAEQFIGPDIALFASHYIAKPPHDGHQVLWHQDGSYWPLEPMEVVTLWLALDDADPENGGMRMIPRSHTNPLSAMLPRPDVPSVLGSGIDPALVDEAQARDLLLKAGDVSIHHPHLIHGSPANQSSRWRRGLTIRYIPTTTRVLAPNHGSFLLRGQPRPGINTYLPRPRYVPGEHLPFRGCEAWA